MYKKILIMFLIHFLFIKITFKQHSQHIILKTVHTIIILMFTKNIFKTLLDYIL